MAAFAANFFITSMKHKNIRPFYSQQAEIAVRTAIRELNNLPNVVKKQEKLAICILRWDFFNLALFFNLPKLQFLQSKVELLELICKKLTRCLQYFRRKY